MKIQSMVSVALIPMTFAGAFATLPAAAAMPEVGTVLSLKQQSAYSGPNLSLGEESFRVIEANAGTAPLGPMTRVVNTQGAVGLSRNEVVLSEISGADARAAVAELGMQTVSVAYQDHVKLAVLRFASLAQAVQARNALLPLLPANAKVSVPIQYAKITPR